MTCFWDGIISSLDNFKIIKLDNTPRPIEFVKALQKLNKKCKNVSWNNKKLTIKEQNEMYVWVKSYNINNLNRGYYCSICDAFLCLVCELFNVHIDHLYLHKTMKYRNTNNRTRKLLTFKSNRGHFSRM